MAQNDSVDLARIRYTRADFTALRAHLNRIALERIADLYYTEDDQDRLGLHTPADLRQRLDAMRDQLVSRACDSMPHLANALRDARTSGRFSKAAIDYLVQAADQDDATPKLGDPLSMWLRPRIAGLLKAEGAPTLGRLIELINSRGRGWWKPIPRIGERKANALVRWLQGYRALAERLNPDALLPVRDQRNDCVVLEATSSVLVPLERIGLPTSLNGEFGQNRHTGYAQTRARNDLEAINYYLIKYAGQPKTLRAYKKELERFLLWSIKKQQKALSDVQTEDCEAYKTFLTNPDEAWRGPKAGRFSSAWRPFTGAPSSASQKYAVTILKAFFEWLVSVGYLRGNPWLTVASPKVSKKLTSIEIGRALPQQLWDTLVTPEGLLDQLCMTPDDVLSQRYRLRGWAASFPISAQYRLARALLLLLGHTGLRREEAAMTTRDLLKPLDGGTLWELAVLGKGDKWRTVFPPACVIVALRAHWTDRELDFEFGMQQLPLLAPIANPVSRRGKEGERFTADSIGQLVSTTLKRIAGDATLDLAPEQRATLIEASTHALRHTFGTLFVANGVPLDVVQSVMGHESLETTTIYVQAEKKRAIEEIGKYFEK